MSKLSKPIPATTFKWQKRFSCLTAKPGTGSEASAGSAGSKLITITQPYTLDKYDVVISVKAIIYTNLTDVKDSTPSDADAFDSFTLRQTGGTATSPIYTGTFGDFSSGSSHYAVVWMAWSNETPGSTGPYPIFYTPSTIGPYSPP